jgi:c-di-GMP-binding flagellar brake protein YcgR
VVQANSEMEKNPPFADNDALRDAKLIFPAEITGQPIKISTLQVKRLKINAETNRYEVAVEFFEMDKSEEQKLTDLIYGLQRQQLRKRLPLGI